MKKELKKSRRTKFSTNKKDAPNKIIYNVKVVEDPVPIWKTILIMVATVIASIGVFAIVNIFEIKEVIENDRNIIEFCLQKAKEFLEISGFGFIVIFFTLAFNIKK